MTSINRRTLLVIAASLLLGSCSSATVMTDWRAPQDEISKRERVAVVALMPEALQRLTVEQEIVKVLRKRGRKALVSSDIPGLTGHLTRARAAPALKAASVDALIVVNLTTGGKGKDIKDLDYYKKVVDPSFYDHGYDWFVPQFANVVTVKENKNHYSQQSYMYAEVNYFDLVNDRAEWSMVTRLKKLDYGDIAKKIGEEIDSRIKSTKTL